MDDECEKRIPIPRVFTTIERQQDRQQRHTRSRTRSSTVDCSERKKSRGHCPKSSNSSRRKAATATVLGPRVFHPIDEQHSTLQQHDKASISRCFRTLSSSTILARRKLFSSLLALASFDCINQREYIFHHRTLQESICHFPE